jgi:hypothetical protein
MRRQPGIPFNFILAVATLAVLLLSAGCTGSGPAHAISSQTPVSEDPAPGPSWNEVPLSDLSGRGNFSVGTFAGKIVLVPVVSVSCPGCIVQLRRQLDEIERLKQQHPGRIEAVSLDLDPEPGPGFMAAYDNPANFTGWSARSPPVMTMALLHRFGPFAIDTEATPVILVCPDGRDLLLPTGVKIAESLNDTITREC